MSKETKQVAYKDIDDELKDKIREEYMTSDPGIVPDDWYEFIFDDFVEKYEKNYGVYIDPDKIEFDIYKRYYKISGTVDYTHPKQIKFMSDEFVYMNENEIIFDLEKYFNNEEFDTDEYNYEPDVARSQLVKDIFGVYETDMENDNFDIEFSDELAENAINFFKKSDSPFLKYSLDSINKLKITIEEAFSLANLFFKNTEIEQDKFDEILNEITDELQVDLENEFFDLQTEIGEKRLQPLYDDFKEMIESEYNSYFEDEYIDGSLEQMFFDVIHNQDGEQEDVIIDFRL